MQMPNETYRGVRALSIGALAALMCLICFSVFHNTSVGAQGPPSGPGRIFAVQSGDARGYGIVAMNTDGSTTFNVTHGNPDGYRFDSPSVSSQTGMIAFTGAGHELGGSRVFVMNGDGSGFRQVTFPTGLPSPNNQTDESPVISPNGTKIAFLSRRGLLEVKPGQFAYPELFVINTDGTGLRQVTQKQQYQDEFGNLYDSRVYSVAWSPDSSKLLFRGYRLNFKIPGPFKFDELWEKINVDGTGEEILNDGNPSHQVSNYEGGGYYLGTAMDWSPDGKILYTVTNGPGTYAEIRILGGGSLNNLQIGQFSVIAECVRFSPDGQQIVYRVGNGQIDTVKLDGTNQKVVFPGSRNPFEQAPLWWAPGPAIPTPDHFTLVPNPVLVSSGHSQQVTPTLFDVQGNVIFHSALVWEFVCDFRDSRIVDHPCTGSANPSVTFTGLVTAGDGLGTLNLCASNAGLSNCTTVRNVGSNVPSAVSVGATQPTTFTSAKGGPGVFTITRDGNAGDTSKAVVINFTLGGTAVRDIDYTLDISGNAITMAGEQTSVIINVRPTGKSAGKGDKTVALTLQPDPANAYTVADNAKTATVIIKDDGPPPGTLFLSSVVPNKGGDGGTVTTTVFGANIKPGATVKLSRSGQADIIGTAASVAANGTSLTSVFDLTGKARGAWDVVVTNPDNTSATLAAAFTIQESLGVHVWVDFVGRYTFRSNLTQAFYIAYGNSGDVDSPPTRFTVFIPAPLQVTGYPILHEIPEQSRGTVPNITAYDGGEMLEFYVPTVSANSSTYAPFLLTAPSDLAHQDLNIAIASLSSPHPYDPAAVQTDPSVTLTPQVLEATDTHARIVQHVKSPTVTGDITSEITVHDVQQAHDPIINITNDGQKIRWEIRATVPKSQIIASQQASLSLKTKAGPQPEAETSVLSEIFAGGEASVEVYLAAHAAIEAREAIEKGVEFDELADCLLTMGIISEATVDSVRRANSGRNLVRISTAAVEGSSAIATILKKSSVPISLSIAAAGQTVNVLDKYVLEQAPLNALRKDICGGPPGLNGPYFDLCRNIESSLTNSEDNEKAKQAFFDQLVIDCLLFEHKEMRSKIYHQYRNAQLKVVFSGDPNEKDGSQGAGPQKYISGFEPLRYVISFENIPAATAPVQTVVIKDQLDLSKLDLSTFSLGAINFDIYGAAPPPGLSSYTTDIDLRPAKNLIARINAQLDKNTGLLTWRFTSIEPATGQPTTDPLAGFLPPDKNAPEGQGSVVFTVMPKPNLPPGTEIRNKSQIVFDTNAPIDTNEYLNTIDNSLPASHVMPLDAVQSSIIFNVNWTGADTGSGIQSYDVFVSENSGVFKLWQSNTTAASGTFIGQPGKTYAFYTEARDGAGNLEPLKTTAEAMTSAPSNIVNAIDDTRFFVRQHYLDFLGRQPDASGWDFWTKQITSCGSTQSCSEGKRINVSAAYFLSLEFQGTGYLVERIYKAAYGSASGTSTLGGTHQLAVPVVRLNELLPDTQEIGRGVVVNQTGWEQLLENNKQAFTAAFVQRSRFTNAFPISMTPAQFVDTLNTNAGNPLSPSERNQLVTDLSTNTKTRAQVLRAVAEDPDLNNAEFNRAFVLMQYFGYLRRNPNDPRDSDYTGYDFWLTKLNQFNGNFINAEMVKAFITSGEYRGRFGP